MKLSHTIFQSLWLIYILLIRKERMSFHTFLLSLSHLLYSPKSTNFCSRPSSDDATWITFRWCYWSAAHFCTALMFIRTKFGANLYRYCHYSKFKIAAMWAILYLLRSRETTQEGPFVVRHEWTSPAVKISSRWPSSFQVIST